MLSYKSERNIKIPIKNKFIIKQLIIFLVNNFICILYMVFYSIEKKAIQQLGGKIIKEENEKE